MILQPLNSKLPTFLFLNNLGGGEILVIVFVILIFFGPKKIPELARGLGRAMREFKDATDEVKREIHKSSEGITNETDITKEVKEISDTIKRDLNP